MFDKKISTLISIKVLRDVKLKGRQAPTPNVAPRKNNNCSENELLEIGFSNASRSVALRCSPGACKERPKENMI